MPAVSFYLSKDVLEAVRAHAKARGLPVSRVIREAVEHYLQVEKKRVSREKVLKALKEKRPLGGREAWEALHKERSEEDACRR